MFQLHKSQDLQSQLPSYVNVYLALICVCCSTPRGGSSICKQDTKERLSKQRTGASFLKFPWQNVSFHLLVASISVSSNVYIETEYSRSSLSGHSRKRTAPLTATFTKPRLNLYLHILLSDHSCKRPRTPLRGEIWNFWFGFKLS